MRESNRAAEKLCHTDMTVISMNGDLTSSIRRSATRSCHRSVLKQFCLIVNLVPELGCKFFALQPHLPLASLVLIIWTPADSSSLSAAPLWPFILQARGLG